MILKIQKPIVGNAYLIYNKTRSVVIKDILLGQSNELDNMLENRIKIYVKGYIDKKGRLRIKEKIKNQEW